MNERTRDAKVGARPNGVSPGSTTVAVASPVPRESRDTTATASPVELFGLFTKEMSSDGGVVDQGLLPFASMADERDDLLGRQLGQRVEDVEIMGRPHRRCRGFGRDERIRSPRRRPEHDSRQRTSGMRLVCHR